MGASKYNSFQGGKDIPVEKYLLHPLWFPRKRYHDLALVSLKYTIKFSARVGNVIRIGRNAFDMEKPYVIFSKGCYMVGWVQEDSRDVENIYIYSLIRIDVDIKRRMDCSRDIPKEIIRNNFNGKYQMQMDQLCVRNSSDEDVCLGETGMPLICEKKLVGIYSWGFGCQNKVSMGIFINLADVDLWISNMIFYEKHTIGFSMGGGESLVQKSRFLLVIFLYFVSL